MIPAFDKVGNLPAGIHRATIQEVLARFGSGSPEREVESQELRDFIDWAKQANIQRLIVNGSFVTSKINPNDVDIVILPAPDYPQDDTSTSDLETRFPFLQIVVAADEDDLEDWALKDFGTDRNRQPKGVVEVILR